MYTIFHKSKTMIIQTCRKEVRKDQSWFILWEDRFLFWNEKVWLVEKKTMAFDFSIRKYSWEYLFMQKFCMAPQFVWLWLQVAQVNKIKGKSKLQLNPTMSTRTSKSGHTNNIPSETIKHAFHHLRQEYDTSGMRQHLCLTQDEEMMT